MKDGLAAARARRRRARGVACTPTASTAPRCCPSSCARSTRRGLDLLQGSRIAGGHGARGRACRSTSTPATGCSTSSRTARLRAAADRLPQRLPASTAAARSRLPFARAVRQLRLRPGGDRRGARARARRRRGAGPHALRRRDLAPQPDHLRAARAARDVALQARRLWCRERRARRGALGSAAVGVLVAAPPAPRGGPALSLARDGAARAGDPRRRRTVNAGYRRTTSQVLVRRVRRPTRASLDYAAYHANFMNADPAPEAARRRASAGRRASVRRALALDADRLDRRGRRSPPTSARTRWRSRRSSSCSPPSTSAGADRLEDVGVARPRRELGPARRPADRAPDGRRGVPARAGARPADRALGQDRARALVPRVLRRARRGRRRLPRDLRPRRRGGARRPGARSSRFVRDEYEGATLSPAEVPGWAHQLASYWYPSYNTDLVDARRAGPRPTPRPTSEASSARLNLPAPTVVMRGKPAGKAVYNVFLVGEPTGAAASAPPTAARTPRRRRPAPLKLAPSVPSPDPSAVARTVRAELAAHGGSWAAWSQEVAPLHAALKRRLAAIPAGAKALPGSDGFLFFARSLAYVLGGDLGKQHGNKNPIPGHRPLPRAAGQARRRSPVRARADQGRDLPGAGGDRARRRRRGVHALRGPGGEPVRAQAPRRSGRQRRRDRRSAAAFLAERAHDTAAKEPLYQRRTRTGRAAASSWRRASSPSA